jgi:hypothetical protein
METSHKKLPADIDREPLFFPPWPMEQVDKVRKTVPKDQITKNSGKSDFVLPEGAVIQSRQAGGDRKRKRLTFSELTDVVVEKKIRSEGEFWKEATQRKMAGDDLMYNTLGEMTAVNKQLSKIIRAWYCSHMTWGTLKHSVDYDLEAFNIPSIIKARRPDPLDFCINIRIGFYDALGPWVMSLGSWMPKEECSARGEAAVLALGIKILFFLAHFSYGFCSFRKLFS